MLCLTTMHPIEKTMPPSLLLLLLIAALTTTASPDTFVYGGCSRLKYGSSDTQYEANVNSLLTTLVNTAMNNPNSYSKFIVSGSNDVIYGMYQCRADLAQPDCSACVQRALSQLGVLCPDACGGAVQLDGCFVKYDNATFLGVQDKSEVIHKCGLPSGFNDPDGLTRRDQVLGYLGGWVGQSFRVGESGSVKGVAQCTGDLSGAQCQDCLTEAIGRLKSQCGPAGWGDMFLGKCYVRYTTGARSNGSSHQDDEIEKTLAILIGLIAGVALIIIFLAFLRKICEGKDGK